MAKFFFFQYLIDLYHKHGPKSCAFRSRRATSPASSAPSSRTPPTHSGNSWASRARTWARLRTRRASLRSATKGLGTRVLVHDEWAADGLPVVELSFIQDSDGYEHDGWEVSGAVGVGSAEVRVRESVGRKAVAVAVNTNSPSVIWQMLLCSSDIPKRSHPLSSPPVVCARDVLSDRMSIQQLCPIGARRQLVRLLKVFAPYTAC